MILLWECYLSNIIIAHCLSGFPEAINGRVILSVSPVTTRLFPELKFGCFGTIVRFTAAVRDASGQQDPKIQIWREDKTLVIVIEITRSL